MIIIIQWDISTGKQYPTFEELGLDESKMSDRKEEHIEITSLIIYIIIGLSGIMIVTILIYQIWTNSGYRNYLELYIIVGIVLFLKTTASKCWI